jgi:hypothetical protein
MWILWPGQERLSVGVFFGAVVVAAMLIFVDDELVVNFSFPMRGNVGSDKVRVLLTRSLPRVLGPQSLFILHLFFSDFLRRFVLFCWTFDCACCWLGNQLEVAMTKTRNGWSLIAVHTAKQTTLQSNGNEFC